VFSISGADRRPATGNSAKLALLFYPCPMRNLACSLDVFTFWLLLVWPLFWFSRL
jgi:hypothetical protein